MSLSAVLKWVELSRVILPAILVASGVPQDRAGAITTAVGDAETALGPGTGQQKLQAVLDGEAQVMKASGASDQTIAATQTAIVTGIAAGVDITNKVQAVAAAHAAGQSAPPPTPPTTA